MQTNKQFQSLLAKQGQISNSRNDGGSSREGRGEVTRHVGKVGETGDTGEAGEAGEAGRIR